MRAWVLRILALAFLTGIGIVAWRYFFPDPAEVIRARMNELAETASFSHQEGNIPKLAKAQKLTSFFTQDASIVVDGPRGGQYRISGWDELREASFAARNALGSLKLQFLDIKVELNANGTEAAVNLTVRGDVGRETDALIQEIKVFVSKADGEWLIKRIETVKVLSANPLSRCRNA